MFQEQILRSSGPLSPAAVPRGSSVGAVEQQAAVFAQRSDVRMFEKTKVPSAEWVDKTPPPPSTDGHAWGGLGVGGSGALVKDIRACLFLMMVQTCNNK